jgi:hypothetical protein
VNCTTLFLAVSFQTHAPFFTKQLQLTIKAILTKAHCVATSQFLYIHLQKTQSALYATLILQKHGKRSPTQAKAPRKNQKKIIIFLNLTYSSSIIWKKEREMKNSLKPKIANW